MGNLRRRALESAAKVVRAAGRRVGPQTELAAERALLKWTWRTAPPAHLAEYLVRGYQSPVINVQSILARHHLVHRLFGDRFAALERAELEFAVEMNARLREEQKRRGGKTGQRVAGVGDAYAAVMRPDPDPFSAKWRAALDGLSAGPLSLAEPACGSANDYRALVATGIAPYLDYHGFDLTPANVANARRNFPGVDFAVGDVLDIQAGDGAYEWVMVHDLFEHLSPTACERAIDEVCRVASEGVLVSFFHMADIADHNVKPVRAYHRNELSLPRTRAAFERHCARVDVTHIAGFVERQFGYARYYNKRAYTFIAWR